MPLPELPWWSEAAGFFGDFYMCGDASRQGHRSDRALTLAQRTIIEVDGVSRLLGLTGKERILDVPCGYGRHSLELARRGHGVVGVDLNATHLHCARGEAVKRGLDIEFLSGDMRTLGYDASFDAVINMFYSFGFFESDDENATVLRNFRAALADGGAFLMHTDVNLARLRHEHYKLQEERELENGARLLIEERFNESARRIEGTWTISQAGAIRSRSYSVRVYEAEEFVRLCLEAGFMRCEVYGGWEGEPYCDGAEELVFIATKGNMQN